MQAATINMFDHGGATDVFTRLLPPILLKRTQLSAMFKCCGLLWQLHLMFGSANMRRLLSR
eukprot:2230366-Pyramimonas_sp.AAC.1